MSGLPIQGRNGFPGCWAKSPRGHSWVRSRSHLSFGAEPVHLRATKVARLLPGGGGGRGLQRRLEPLGGVDAGEPADADPGDGRLPDPAEVVDAGRDLAALGQPVEALEVLVVPADEVEGARHSRLAAGEVGELGGHGALGGLAPVVVRAGEGLHVAHGQDRVDGPAQGVLERVQPGPHPVEAPVDVTHPHDERGVAQARALGSAGVNKLGRACPSQTSSPSAAPPSTTSSPSRSTSPRRRWWSSPG